MKIWRDWSIERAFVFISRVEVVSRWCWSEIKKCLAIGLNQVTMGGSRCYDPGSPVAFSISFSFRAFHCCSFLAHSLLISITSFREQVRTDSDDATLGPGR